MVKTFIILATLAMATPAVAQGAAAQSWPVMGNHSLDMPATGAHSRSRPWLKVAAMPAKKAGKAKRPS